MSGLYPTKVVTYTGYNYPSCQKVGNYVYGVNRDESNNFFIEIINVSNPYSPTVECSLTSQALGLGVNDVQGRDIIVEGDYAYIISHTTSRLVILNISDPSSPTVESNLTTGIDLTDVYQINKIGDYLFWAFKSDAVEVSLMIVDVSDVTSPSVIANTVLSVAYNKYQYATCQMAIYGTALYIPICTSFSTPNTVIHIVDISTIGSPSPTSTVSTSAICQSVFVDGNYLYISQYSSGALGLSSFDLTSPYTPSLEDAIVGPTVNGYGVFMYKIDEFLYVSTNSQTGPQRIGVYRISDPSSLEFVSLGGSIGSTGNIPIFFRTSYENDYALISGYNVGLIDIKKNIPNIGN